MKFKRFARLALDHTDSEFAATGVGENDEVLQPARMLVVRCIGRHARCDVNVGIARIHAGTKMPAVVKLMWRPHSGLWLGLSSKVHPAPHGTLRSPPRGCFALPMGLCQCFGLDKPLALQWRGLWIGHDDGAAVLFE